MNQYINETSKTGFFAVITAMAAHRGPRWSQEPLI